MRSRVIAFGIVVHTWICIYETAFSRVKALIDRLSADDRVPIILLPEMGIIVLRRNISIFNPFSIVIHMSRNQLVEPVQLRIVVRNIILIDRQHISLSINTVGIELIPREFLCQIRIHKLALWISFVSDDQLHGQVVRRIVDSTARTTQRVCKLYQNLSGLEV